VKKRQTKLRSPGNQRKNWSPPAKNQQRPSDRAQKVDGPAVSGEDDWPQANSISTTQRRKTVAGPAFADTPQGSTQDAAQGRQPSPYQNFLKGVEGRKKHDRLDVSTSTAGQYLVAD